jgi:hypothetical protein
LSGGDRHRSFRRGFLSFRTPEKPILSTSRCFLLGAALAAAASTSGLALGSPGGGSRGKVTPEEFADRWVAATQACDRSGIERLFMEKAKLAFESAGRTREVDPPHYGSLLAAALGGLKGLSRERGEVELVASDEAEKGPLLWFTVTDRLRTADGYLLRAVNKEEFELAPQDGSRAIRYRSRTLSCETEEKPQPWMNYGGPGGLNGFLVEAHFQAAPEGMGVAIVGAVAGVLIFVKVLHSLGIGLRRRPLKGS